MWSKVIDILLKEIIKHKDKKARFKRAIKELYEALEECHQAYLEYHNHPDYDELNMNLCFEKPHNGWPKEYENYMVLREKHFKAIVKLIERIWKVRDVLPIFAPKVLKHLQKYTIREIWSWAPKDLMEYYYHSWEGYLTQAGIPSSIREYYHIPIEKRIELMHLASWAWEPCKQISRPSKKKVGPTEYAKAISKLKEFIGKHFDPHEFY